MARTRSSTTALVRMLAASSLPVYALDSHRTIIYCNSACAEWTGAETAQLIGSRCDYHSLAGVPESLQIAAGLCPPPEVFSGRRADGIVICHKNSGQLIRRRGEFLPLKSQDSNLAGVLAVLDSFDLPPSAPSPAGDPSPAQLHQQLLVFRQQIAPRYRLDRLAGDSAVMRRVRAQVQLAIEGGANILISGPPGSGREHVARTIFYGRAEGLAGRLVPVACSLVDAEMMQATIKELNATSTELPRRATALLLLDVDVLAPEAQNELAGFLNVSSFNLLTLATAQSSLLQINALPRPSGATKVRRTSLSAAERLSTDKDVRRTENFPQDAQTLIACGAEQFRRDLALSLSTLVIELPALSDRAEDIPLLAQMFLEDMNAAGDRQLSGFTHEALDQLAAYPWPGNMDELTEFVGYAFRRAAGPLVSAADLPDRVRFAADASSHAPRPQETIVLDEFLSEIETELIHRALQYAKGNRTKAAQLLGITRSRLLRRLEPSGPDFTPIDE